MSRKVKILLGALALVVAFAFGRYSAPTSVKSDTKSSETDNKKNETDKEATKHVHKKTTVVEITKPDGTKEKTTTTTETDDTDKKSSKVISDDKSKSSEVVKEETRSSSRVTISALAGTNMSSPLTPDFGAMVCKDVLGPISVGVFGFKSGMFGASVGLSF